MKNRLLTGLLVIFIIFLGIPAGTAYAAGADFGIRAGTYSESNDFFIGAGINSYLGNNIYMNPNIEYATVDPGTYLTLNMDFHYDFGNADPIYTWAGAGPALHYYSAEEPGVNNTEFGVNLLFGVGFDTNSNVIPYIQGKAILAESDDFSLGFGLRF